MLNKYSMTLVDYPSYDGIDRNTTIHLSISINKCYFIKNTVYV